MKQKGLFGSDLHDELSRYAKTAQYVGYGQRADSGLYDGSFPFVDYGSYVGYNPYVCSDPCVDFVRCASFAPCVEIAQHAWSFQCVGSVQSVGFVRCDDSAPFARYAPYA